MPFCHEQPVSLDPSRGLTQGMPVADRGRNKHSCSLLGYENLDSQSRKGPATFSWGVNSTVLLFLTLKVRT